MPVLKSGSLFRILTGIGMFIGWLAVFLQYILLLKQNPDLSLTEATMRFFTFFTILTNILVAVSFSILCFPRPPTRGEFFLRPNTVAAIALYILMVGATYNIILRSDWHPQGLQKIVDETLHSFIPAYYFICWLVFLPKAALPWKSILPWMIYPLIYLIVAMARGALNDYYPYPFLMVTKLGYPKVLLNCLFITLAFFFLGFVIIALGRTLKKSGPGRFQ